MTAFVNAEARDGMSEDRVPALFEELARDAQFWLTHVFPGDCGLIPVLLARQEMASHFDIVHSPSSPTPCFRIVRVGDSTFDLQAVLVDRSGRAALRATTVFGVADRATACLTSIPLWLSRTLKRKGSFGGFSASAQSDEETI